MVIMHDYYVLYWVMMILFVYIIKPFKALVIRQSESDLSLLRKTFIKLYENIQDMIYMEEVMLLPIVTRKS